jgi:hypothetical protein
MTLNVVEELHTKQLTKIYHLFPYSVFVTTVASVLRQSTRTNLRVAPMIRFKKRINSVVRSGIEVL